MSTKRRRSRKLTAPTIHIPKVAKGEFHQESPLKLAMRYAHYELRGSAKPSQIQWLLEHPFWWYRALHQLRMGVENNISKDRLALGAFAPLPGPADVAVHRIYMEKKRAYAPKYLKQRHVLRLLELKREEVKGRFGADVVDRQTIGDIVDFMTTIDQLLEEDDIGTARSAIAGYLKGFQQ